MGCPGDSVPLRLLAIAHHCHMVLQNKLIVSHIQLTRWQSYGLGSTFAIGLFATN